MTLARALHCASQRHSAASPGASACRPSGPLARAAVATRSVGAAVRTRSASFLAVRRSVVAPAPTPKLSSSAPAPVPYGCIQVGAGHGFTRGRGDETGFETAFETEKARFSAIRQGQFQSFTASRAYDDARAYSRACARKQSCNFETGETFFLNGRIQPFSGFTGGFIGRARLETNKIGGGYGG